jgi:hypothetical protein
VFILHLNGAPLAEFAGMMNMSLILVSVTSLAVWGSRHTIQPVMVRRFEGGERLWALLDRLPARLTAEQTVARVLDEVQAFLGDVEAGDDITVMAAGVLDGAPG